ncbi:MAG: CPBP family intramembrane metalloprotease [Candidatus Sericytochromatia bacterium]|nr:CPBP family intramembrane metalloprotease [Candidatus Tanganyikabacteria bacterium]
MKSKRVAAALALAGLSIGPRGEAAAQAAPLDNAFPAAAASAEIVPGLGHLMLGDPGEGLIWAGFIAAPAVLALAGMPPMIRSDFRSYYVLNPVRPLVDPGPASLFATVAWKLSWVDMYWTYEKAKALSGYRTYSPPHAAPSLTRISRAPFLAENLADWRVWTTVAAGLASRYVLVALIPDVPRSEGGNPAVAHTIEGEPEAPPAIEARTATVLGAEVPAWAGLALDYASIPVLAYAPAIGEEALFRGLVQGEAEHLLGPVGGPVAMSAFFGAIHIRPNPWPVMARQFAVTASAAAILCILYQQSDYDITKPMAAHYYFNLIDYARDFWRPDPGGASVIGIKYRY